LVNVPPHVGEDMECVAVPDDESGKRPQEKYYGTTFRERQEPTRTLVKIVSRGVV
jgi:hypothetical protein